MAFQNLGTLTPYGAPVKLHRILANSGTFTINDSLKLASGFLAAGTAGALVFGHLQGIVTLKGMPMSTTGVLGAEVGSFVGTFAVTSNNQTVAMTRGECDASKFTLYSATESQAIGTTTGSNLAGYTQDLADAVSLTETTALTTTGQYMGHGVDPANSAKAVVNIYESQVFGV